MKNIAVRKKELSRTLNYNVLAIIGLGFVCSCAPLYNLHDDWSQIKTENQCTSRHECAAVAIDSKYYLLGGRGIKPVEVLEMASGKWQRLAETPLEMHHFQAIAYQQEIYVLGAFTGKYPHEQPIDHVWIFNPAKNQWREGAEIPEARRRGAAGAFLFQNKIYLVAGIKDGHYDGHVGWLDVFDPKTQQWDQLPDAPHARDHFQAAVINDELYLAGGRRSSAKTKEVFQLTEAAVDKFNFIENKWETLPISAQIPTPRAGCTSIVVDDQLFVIGGESAQPLAHNDVEVFNPKTNTWASMSKLLTGRHGTQAALINGHIVIAAGCANQGGKPELNSIETL